MFCCALRSCIRGDVIIATELIQDPGSIASSGGLYKLGCFSPNGSVNWYVGIWHNGISAYSVLWVANCDKPILGSTGAMMISDDSNLVLMNGKKEVIWSSNVSTLNKLKCQNIRLRKHCLAQSLSPVANDSDVLWQSFDHMSNLFLAKRKLSSNIGTNDFGVLLLEIISSTIGPKNICQMGLLCTQLAKDRPAISTVIPMPHGEIVDLPSRN
ncbi:hypothetical protein EUGRSUZ_D00775 [Eucalyptus grandis]|uniref:Uncharacterized protein n=2 Tax=Eucalyptus grandis TaxID=71139 RepID=A0ACC3L483_EUCGR|nr:hypothetical protein EUGRSUZ_D00775 [Eucalyptus grandis]